MKLKTLLFAGFFIQLFFAQDRKINFEHLTLSEAVQKAKTENKSVFIDCMTSWCVPCKRMDKTIFSLNEVADYFNANFINLKLDMDSLEGAKLNQKIPVNVYPTYFFLDTAGHLIHRSAGLFSSGQDFLKLGEASFNQELQYVFLEREFETNPNLDKNQILKLMEYKLPSGLNYDQDLNSYFSKLNDEEKISASNFHILARYLSRTDQIPFRFLYENYDKYLTHVGKDSLDHIINTIFLVEHNVFMTQDDFSETAYAAYIKQLETISYRNKNSLLLYLKLNRYAILSQADALIREAFQNETLLDNDSKQLVVRILIEFSTDAEQLTRGINWMKALVQETHEKDAYSCLLLGGILYKNGGKSEAEHYFELAQNLVKGINLYGEEDFVLNTIQEIKAKTGN